MATQGNIGDYPWHPLAAGYPLMPDDELKLIALNMEEFGYDARFPIVLYQKMILDGRHRQIAAANAKVRPVYVELPEGEDPVAFVQRANEHRRHLTQEWLIQQREKRIAEKRQQGKSTRKIADEEGVSQSQVIRDLNNQVNRRGSPETRIPIDDPPKTTGRDGKSYSAKRKQPDESTPAPQPDSQIPKDVANILADTWHMECAKNLNKMLRECKAAFSWSSWLDAEILRHLKDAEQCFLAAVPRKICPDCKGKKAVKGQACLTCRQGGYLAGQVVEC